VCNSVGECHCEIGYGPPDCSSKGCGGSYHGGSPTPGCVNVRDEGCKLLTLRIFRISFTCPYLHLLLLKLFLYSLILFLSLCRLYVCVADDEIKFIILCLCSNNVTSATG